MKYTYRITDAYDAIHTFEVPYPPMLNDGILILMRDNFKGVVEAAFNRLEWKYVELIGTEEDD